MIFSTWPEGLLHIPEDTSYSRNGVMESICGTENVSYLNINSDFYLETDDQPVTSSEQIKWQLIHSQARL